MTTWCWATPCRSLPDFSDDLQSSDFPASCGPPERPQLALQSAVLCVLKYIPPRRRRTAGGKHRAISRRVTCRVDAPDVSGGSWSRLSLLSHPTPLSSCCCFWRRPHRACAAPVPPAAEVLPGLHCDPGVRYGFGPVAEVSRRTWQTCARYSGSHPGNANSGRRSSVPQRKPYLSAPAQRQPRGLEMHPGHGSLNRAVVGRGGDRLGLRASGHPVLQGSPMPIPGWGQPASRWTCPLVTPVCHYQQPVCAVKSSRTQDTTSTSRAPSIPAGLPAHRPSQLPIGVERAGMCRGHERRRRPAWPSHRHRAALRLTLEVWDAVAQAHVFEAAGSLPAVLKQHDGESLSLTVTCTRRNMSRIRGCLWRPTSFSLSSTS